jgi:hypothetical protein
MEMTKPNPERVPLTVLLLVGLCFALPTAAGLAYLEGNQEAVGWLKLASLFVAVATVYQGIAHEMKARKAK